MLSIFNLKRKLENKVSIRSPQDTEKYPELTKIREAMIFVFDNLLTKSDAEEREAEEFVDHLVSRGLKGTPSHINQGEFLNLLDANNIEPLVENRELLINFAFFYLLTSRKCQEASHNVAKYINTKYKNEFAASVIKSGRSFFRPTKYFIEHSATVIYSKKTGLWYCVSPANIFNIHFEFPKYQNHPFQRATDVLVANSYEDLISQLQKIEGGTWPSKL